MKAEIKALAILVFDVLCMFFIAVIVGKIVTDGVYNWHRVIAILLCVDLGSDVGTEIGVIIKESLTK